MSDECRNEWTKDEEIDSVVDEAFKFIYEETHSDSDSGESNPATVLENYNPILDDIELVLEEHFSFLNDEDGYLQYSSDEDNIPECFDTESIYSNVEQARKRNRLPENNYNGSVPPTADDDDDIIDIPSHDVEGYKETIYENVYPSSTSSRRSTEDKLDIRISDEGTNIYTGSTVINIPATAADHSNSLGVGPSNIVSSIYINSDEPMPNIDEGADESDFASSPFTISFTPDAATPAIYKLQSSSLDKLTGTSVCNLEDHHRFPSPMDDARNPQHHSPDNNTDKPVRSDANIASSVSVDIIGSCKDTSSNSGSISKGVKRRGSEESSNSIKNTNEVKRIRNEDDEFDENSSKFEKVPLSSETIDTPTSPLFSFKSAPILPTQKCDPNSICEDNSPKPPFTSALKHVIDLDLSCEEIGQPRLVEIESIILSLDSETEQELKCNSSDESTNSNVQMQPKLSSKKSDLSKILTVPINNVSTDKFTSKLKNIGNITQLGNPQMPGSPVKLFEREPLSNGSLLTNEIAVVDNSVLEGQTLDLIGDNLTNLFNSGEEQIYPIEAKNVALEASMVQPVCSSSQVEASTLSDSSIDHLQKLLNFDKEVRDIDLDPIARLDRLNSSIIDNGMSQKNSNNQSIERPHSPPIDKLPKIQTSLSTASSVIEAFNSEVVGSIVQTSSNRSPPSESEPCFQRINMDYEPILEPIISSTSSLSPICIQRMISTSLDHDSQEVSIRDDGLPVSEDETRLTIEKTTEALSAGPSGHLESDDNSTEETGLASAVSRAIRRSMRRMRQIRLSGRRSKRSPSEAFAYYNEGIVSEETEGRRDILGAPPIGLPSVRSPTASAILLPSIMAALSPDIPREEFPPPTVDERDLSFQRPQPADYRNGPTSNRYNDVSSPAGSSDPQSSIQQGTSPPERSEAAGTPSVSPREPAPVYSAIERENAARQNRQSGSGTHHGNTRRHARARSRRSNRPGMSPDRGVRVNSHPSSRSAPSSSARVASNCNTSSEHLVEREARNAPSMHTTRSSSRSSSTSSQVFDDPSTLNQRRAESNNRPRIRPTTTTTPLPDIISGYIFPLREYWPHNLSGLMTCLPLTLNVFNISRFAVFGAKYGWQFPIQWGIISLVFGLPLLAFQMAVGQLIGAGPVDMWVISPIFQGVGYAVLIGEAILGIYCSVPIAWMFTYFRDSFDMRHFRCITSFDCDNPHNLSAEINHVVPKFFTSNILGRPEDNASILVSLGSIQFNLTFNLVLIWVITFLALSRGAKTLGKVCYLSFLLPLLCYLVVCCYLIYVAVTQLPMGSFKPRFLDKQSWMAASREAFLVWALHGAALQQLTAGNRRGHPLWRDTTVIALLTGAGLCLASFCGIVCATVLSGRALKFTPSSFETAVGRKFIGVLETKSAAPYFFGDDRSVGDPEMEIFASQDIYDNFYAGIRIRKHFSDPETISLPGHRSGYNSVRLLCEMFPALLFTLRIPMVAYIPPLFFLSLLLFGISHQLSLWYAVVQGVMRLRYTRLRPMETFITFCCCVFGFSAALPMVTGAGIHILYFMDFLVGSAWWLMILQLIQVFGVLLVRGKPFAAGDVSRELFGSTGKNCALKNAASLAWTVLTPVGLVVATISSFQAGDYRQVFTWECPDWPVWVCQVASGLQLLPLLLVPLFGLLQTCIFLAHPRHNIIQKIEYLYRPPPFRDQALEDDPFFIEADDPLDPFRGELVSRANEERQNTPFHDPPPKYTPPPSYSTATGSSLAKSFENTLRRSFRYLRGANSSRVVHSPLPT